MKRVIGEFFRRGMSAMGLGPLVLAVSYFVMQHQGVVNILTVDQVCLEIVSLSALAFVAGALNALYQIERLPLMLAILIHGIVLYISYLATYLLNGWLEWGRMPVVVFTCIFCGGYLVIWVIIYSIIKRNTDRINAILRQKRRTENR